MPWRLEGKENIPRSGGYILVANHINWKDPPWIEFALGRAIRYMGKQELFDTPVVGFVLREIGAFPVRRGEVDRRALHVALAVSRQASRWTFAKDSQRIRALIGDLRLAYVAQRFVLRSSLA